MKDLCFCVYGDAPALRYARNSLASWGYSVCHQPETAVTHLLLPVPIFDLDVMPVLERLPDTVTVFGGNLPALPVRSVDLLQDPYYTAENAAITAHCALRILMQTCKRTLTGAKILILGWGRIAKCLAPLLASLGAQVTIAARKNTDRAMAMALGFGATSLPLESGTGFDGIINTVPAPVMDAKNTREGAILLDLASKKGLIGDDVLWERGLPGRLAPESAGMLIAKTVLRYALGKE